MKAEDSTKKLHEWGNNRGDNKSRNFADVTNGSSLERHHDELFGGSG